VQFGPAAAHWSLGAKTLRARGSLPEALGKAAAVTDKREKKRVLSSMSSDWNGELRATKNWQEMVKEEGNSLKGFGKHGGLYIRRGQTEGCGFRSESELPLPK
jgi:hypothetical protein